MRWTQRLSAWIDQRAEYRTNMRVKHGELVWDPDVSVTTGLLAGSSPDGIPLRGAFVTPEEYAARRAVTA